jgi:uncharacterized protein YpuA (DUF1002 family)
MWTWLKNIFNFFKKVFQAFLDEAIPETEKRLTALFKDVAIDIVDELRSADLTSAEKAKEAFNRIKNEIVKSGEEASDSYINWLRETAYRHVKKN